MDDEVKRRIEVALAWIGPLFVVLYLLFWCVLGKNLPPPNMLGMSGAELVSEFYGKYQSQIAIGNVGAASVGILYLPWACLLGSMLRDENGSISVLGLIEITGGALTAWIIAMAPAMWAACAIFSDRIDPELIKFAHVLTWCVFDTTYMVTTVEMFALGLYIVLHKKQTIFPKWCGWLSFIVGYMFMLLVLIPFIDGGPFAVGGVVNFWLQMVGWLGWMSCITFYMLRSLRPRAEVAQLRTAHSY